MRTYGTSARNVEVEIIAMKEMPPIGGPDFIPPETPKF